MTPMVFKSGEARIENNPSRTSVAAIYDKEILLYIASLMAERAEKGEKADRIMTFTANDLFRSRGLSIGVQKEPPIGVQKGLPSLSNMMDTTGATSAKRLVLVVPGVSCGA